MPDPEQLISKINIKQLAVAERKSRLGDMSTLTRRPTLEVATTPSELSKGVDSARTELEQLADTQVSTPDEFITASSAALARFQTLSSQIIGHKAELFTQRDKLVHELNTLGSRRIQLESATGLEKIKNIRKRRQLASQEADLRKQMTAIDEEIEASRTQLREISDKDKPVAKKQKELLLQEVTNEIQQVVSTYREMYEEIIADGTIPREIQEKYIDIFIRPKVEDLRLSGQLTDSEAVEFYSTLTDFLDHQKPDDPQYEPTHFTLGNYTRDSKFSEIGRDLRTLFSKPHEEIIQTLLVTLAAGDIIDIKKSASSSFLYEDYFSESVEQAITPANALDPNYEFGRSIESRIDRGVSADLFDFVAVKFWQALKDTPTARSLFGDQIDQLDQRYYRNLIDISLTNQSGVYIDRLVHYPTPKTIKTLVILAAADERKRQTAHANWALIGLRENPEWNNLLSEAVSEYPELEKVKPLLETWNFGNDGNHPKIQQAATTLTKKVVEQNTDEKHLVRLALQALPNNELLNMLVPKGVLTKDEVTIIQDALEVIDTAVNENKISIQETDFKIILPTINDHYFNRAVRNSSFSWILPDSESPGISMRHLVRLSSLIRDNRLNLSVLEGLTQQRLIKWLHDPTKNAEGILTFYDKFYQTDALLSAEQSVEIDENNWHAYLMTYIGTQSVDLGLPALPEKSDVVLKKLFADPKTKDLCLEQFDLEWRNYLGQDNLESMPASLQSLTSFIEYCEGAGHLSQVESLSKFISGFQKALQLPETTEKTKTQLLKGLLNIENRFVQEKWSNEAKTDFYNISRDILSADPSLYVQYLELFEKLSPKQLKHFMSEIYPLYRTELIMMENILPTGEKKIDATDLAKQGKSISTLTHDLTTDTDALKNERKRLIDNLTARFQERFGIIKIPETFTPDHIRSLSNITLYLSNLNAKTPEKEVILSYYLSLMLNNGWDGFREGIEYDANLYLAPDRANKIAPLLQERRRISPLTTENLGVPEEQIPEFMRLLQHETQTITIGNIETIDVKLYNIILNLRTLEDLDLYKEPLDKRRMQILLEFGNKTVGSAIAKIYQTATNPDRQIIFSPDEEKVRTQVHQALEDSKLQISPQNIKLHFQDGLKPFSTVVNLLGFVQKTGAEVEIDTLRKLLQPSQQIVDVFRRLGEDFTPTSGAFALTQDLNLLDNLIVKRADELTDDERSLLVSYTSDIRNQMISLEEIFQKITTKFSAIKQSTARVENEDFQKKLTEIQGIINAQDQQQTITSTMTNNLNTIIENMRECLSCNKEGSNNDTNLSLGDTNKFYLFSQSESQTEGSIADQLVYLVPVTRQDETQEIAFVMDKLYGTHTPIILENQIAVVVKKLGVLKQRFPESKISVLVSNAALVTSGTSADLLLQTLQKKRMNAQEETVTVNITPSAMSDHYIEIGGLARTSGPREVNGIIITL